MPYAIGTHQGKKKLRTCNTRRQLLRAHPQLRAERLHNRIQLAVMPHGSRARHGLYSAHARRNAGLRQHLERADLWPQSGPQQLSFISNLTVVLLGDGRKGARRPPQPAQKQIQNRLNSAANLGQR